MKSASITTTAFLSLLILTCPGCASIASRVDMHDGPFSNGTYPGVRFGASEIHRYGTNGQSGWVIYHVVDMPGSSILDTLLLPFDLTH